MNSIKTHNTQYKYRADGVKLQKKHLFFTGRTQNFDTIEQTDYLDGFQYSYSTGGDPGSGFPQGLQFVSPLRKVCDFERIVFYNGSV